MIPKKIHYCWFGRNPLPKSAQKCIASWKKFFPDYEIIEWNEDNYNINKIPYLTEAYNAKKYAYVSDYARFDILYHEGGIYFDTDVEVIKSFDNILVNGAFFGCEVDGNYPRNDERAELKGKDYGKFAIRINPGLGMAAEKGNLFYKEFLDLYENYRFIKSDGTFNLVAVVRNTTNLLVGHGLKDISGQQIIAGINIYPRDYFNPLDSATGVLHKTSATYSIHWYTLSWMSHRQRIKIVVAKKVRRIFRRIK
jgi:hypothetical protein